MSFIADKQTLEDLNLLSKYRSNSIYSLFNIVRTGGGKKLLDNMFDFPLTDPGQINARSDIFKYFAQSAPIFSMDPEQFVMMEDYLGSAEGKDRMDLLRIKVMALVGLDKEYRTIQDGFYTTVELLNSFNGFIRSLPAEGMPPAYAEKVEAVAQVFKDKRLGWLPGIKGLRDLSQTKMAGYDTVLRYTMQEEMKQVMQLIYLTDVYFAVGSIGHARGFTYAKALPASESVVQISGLYHPEIRNAVANNIRLDADSNVLFLTGANMAGKSTTMKAFGIAVYLAHMGFPVAAGEMSFSVKDGLYTSINVPDNLNLGYSHFYAEVLRVKKVAEEVSRGKNLLVIFDELFKGTNVKDAYDATLAVTKAFSDYRNCVFIISTHIIEVGQELGLVCDNLQFVYLPTVMEGQKPTYTYKLQQGITEDRHGMMIINNEKILEMIYGK